MSILVFIGTYTENKNPAVAKSEGIYVYRLNPADGSLAHTFVMKGVINPSFLAFHPGGRLLYAANEVEQFDGQPGGGVSAFSINPQTGELALLNHQLSHGGSPCHLNVDATGEVLLVGNYNGGNLSLFPIAAGAGAHSFGKLQPATHVIQHFGSGPDPHRQAGPHVHSITLDLQNRIAIVADLGLDKLMLYQLDLAEHRLIPHRYPWVSVQPGAGPRHVDFHPNGRFVYLINELNSSLTAFNYDPEEGALQEIQTVPTLPEGFSGVNWPADVHVAPSGEFVYGSNRGHDSIVIYSVDGQSGRLAYVGHTPTLGKCPRNFAVDPTGAFLLAANQDSWTVVTFWIDKQTGKLTPTGQSTPVPSPVCIKMVSVDL